MLYYATHAQGGVSEENEKNIFYYINFIWIWLNIVW